MTRIKGCRVVGIAGGREECDWLLKEAGFDAAIDYKDENRPAMTKHCPKGIDVCFDEQCLRHRSSSITRSRRLG